MSSSSAEDAVNTRSVPRATVVRAVLTVAISALLTGVLFSYFYIEVFNAPEPHRLPVAVVGADASRLSRCSTPRSRTVCPWLSLVPTHHVCRMLWAMGTGWFR